MSGDAPDCPVRHPTEGKNCLPGLLPTAPSCLGAIKGTPRRMEEHTKHTLSNLNLSHSVFAHSIDILSDLSSVLVVNLLRFIRAQVLAVCVRIAADLCVLLPSLTLSAFTLIFYCKGERLQVVEIPRKRERLKKEEHCGIQVDHWIT